MHVLTPLRGLGAVPRPSSTDPDLKKGYVWSPYLVQVGSSAQHTSCGFPEARKTWYGVDRMFWVGDRPACWEKNGGAWGQTPAIGEHLDDARQLISRSTTVTTTTRPPAESPGEACARSWTTWRGVNTAAVRCAGDGAAKQKFLSICNRTHMGVLGQSAGQREWMDYVAARCSSPPPKLPPPRTPPTSVPPPADRDFPPMDSPPLDFPPGDLPRDGRDPGEGFDPGTDDVPSTGARAFLRQVGPVVGIGLLAAIVLTVARKKKLKLFRRR